MRGWNLAFALMLHMYNKVGASMSEYTHNHYVPVWYQRRFLAPNQSKYFYLDLTPDQLERDGHRYTRRSLLNWSPERCFAQDDLYTTTWGVIRNVEIEKFFFGRVDEEGRRAATYFRDFVHPSADQDAFNQLMIYMSVQKLRTPKGLMWLQRVTKMPRNLTLMALQNLQNMHCAIWTECVWQIASAEQSATKLIISDHPVTVYNRGCFPLSDYCKGCNDPDIRLVATHTYFPLSIDKVLILTNLSWVRNPYQRETRVRPNPNLFRPAMFNYMDIQTHRDLTDQEVLGINYITKKRAFRYIAAAEEEWLYPEKYLGEQHWRKLGDGLLLMPEPRDINMGGEITIGYADGSHDWFSEYGHKPWQPGFRDEKRFEVEWEALERFKSEFARMQGPAWRGTSHQFHRQGPQVDSAEYHEHLLRKASEYDRGGRRRRHTDT